MKHGNPFELIIALFFVCILTGIECGGATEPYMCNTYTYFALKDSEQFPDSYELHQYRQSPLGTFDLGYYYVHLSGQCGGKYAFPKDWILDWSRNVNWDEDACGTKDLVLIFNRDAIECPVPDVNQLEQRWYSECEDGDCLEVSPL